MPPVRVVPSLGVRAERRWELGRGRGVVDVEPGERPGTAEGFAAAAANGRWPAADLISVIGPARRWSPQPRGISSASAPNAQRLRPGLCRGRAVVEDPGGAAAHR
jgi:hypothetical protein